MGGKLVTIDVAAKRLGVSKYHASILLKSLDADKKVGNRVLYDEAILDEFLNSEKAVAIRASSSDCFLDLKSKIGKKLALDFWEAVETRQLPKHKILACADISEATYRKIVRGTGYVSTATALKMCAFVRKEPEDYGIKCSDKIFQRYNSHSSLQYNVDKIRADLLRNVNDSGLTYRSYAVVNKIPLTTFYSFINEEHNLTIPKLRTICDVIGKELESYRYTDEPTAEVKEEEPTVTEVENDEKQEVAYTPESVNIPCLNEILIPVIRDALETVFAEFLEKHKDEYFKKKRLFGRD